MTTMISEQSHSTASRVGRDRRGDRHAAMQGARVMLPWLLGVAPFGLVVGITARTSDVSMAVGLLTGAAIYSGSAQLTAVELLDSGASVAVVVASVLIINARLILYSASIAPAWRGTGLGFRATAAALLVEPSYVVGMHAYERELEGNDRRAAHIEYLAAAITLFFVWHVAMIAGAAIGAGVPGWLGLEHTVPLFLLAEVVQAVRSRPAAAAALAGGIVAVGGGSLPLHSGVLAAVLVGVIAAVSTERLTS
jgi:predicted branched-subunit amino acid permease